jgi:hypothetical protein
VIKKPRVVVVSGDHRLPVVGRVESTLPIVVDEPWGLGPVKPGTDWVVRVAIGLETTTEVHYSPRGARDIAKALNEAADEADGLNDLVLDCDCNPEERTGGVHDRACPAWEPECTCYESPEGHMSGCPMRRA